MTIDKLQTEIEIWDALPGSGKTLKMKRHIASANTSTDKFICITPFLGELHRIAQTTPRPLKKGEDKSLEGKTPPIRDRYKQIVYKEDTYDKTCCIKDFRFQQPEIKNSQGSKRESFKRLLSNKENIVSTHQLYQTFDKDTLIDCEEYTLIIDEAISVYETYYELSAKVVKEQIALGNMYLDEDGITIRMVDDSFNLKDIKNISDGSFDLKEYKILCDEGMLLLLHNSVVMWKLPKELFNSFKKIIICTYQFRGSLLEAYLLQNNLKYKVDCWENKPSSIKHLINIYEGPLNQESDDTLFHYSWYADSDNRDLARKLLNNYFTNVNKCTSKDRLWTCYTTSITSNGTLVEDINNEIGTLKYKKQWLAFNTKATNNYSDRHNVAYLVNLHYKPALRDLINKVHATKDEELKKGFIKRNEELYAINEMIQFIWRSAIRNDEIVNVFIPSKRMRTLLKNWLDDKYEPYRNYII